VAAPDPLEGVGSTVDTQKRAALQALAQYGSAGIDQLNRAQSSVKSAQASALEQAAAGGQNRGEDSAVAAQVAATVARPGNEYGQALETTKGAYGAANTAAQSAADLYFREVTGAIGASRAGSDATIGLAREQYRLEQQAKLDAAAAAAARSGGGGGGGGASKLTIDQLLKMIEGQSALDKEAAQAQQIAQAAGSGAKPVGLTPELARALATQESSTGAKFAPVAAPDITYNPNPNTNIPYSTHDLAAAQGGGVDQQRRWDSMSRGALYAGSVAQPESYIGGGFNPAVQKAQTGRDALMAALAQAAAPAQAPASDYVERGPGAIRTEQSQLARARALPGDIQGALAGNDAEWQDIALRAQQQAALLGQELGVPQDIQDQRDRAALAYQGYYGLDPQSAAAMAADKYPSPTAASRVGDLRNQIDLQNLLTYGTTTAPEDPAKKLDDALAAKAGLPAGAVPAIRREGVYSDASQALAQLEQKQYVDTINSAGDTVKSPITADIAALALYHVLSANEPNFDPSDKRQLDAMWAVIHLVLAEGGQNLLSAGAPELAPGALDALFAAP
jgi:hypothetical protein